MNTSIILTRAILLTINYSIIEYNKLLRKRSLDHIHAHLVIILTIISLI